MNISVKHLQGVLWRIYRDPLFIQANYAREFAFEIATLSSLGLITNNVGPELLFDRRWRLTREGHEFLEQKTDGTN